MAGARRHFATDPEVPVLHRRVRRADRRRRHIGLDRVKPKDHVDRCQFGMAALFCGEFPDVFQTRIMKRFSTKQLATNWLKALI